MSVAIADPAHLVGLIWLLFGVGSIIVTSIARVDKQNLSQWLLFGICSALLVGSVLVYFANQVTHSLTWALLVSDITVAIAFTLRYKPVVKFINLLKLDHHLLRRYLLNLVIAVAFITVFASLEKILPEYDGYIHERVTDLMLSSGKMGDIQGVYRPGFFYLVALFKLIGGNDNITYTKFVFPVLLTLLTIEGFQLLNPPKKTWLTWLAVLSAPLLISELIYFRSQSFVVLLFPLAIFTYFIEKDRRLQLAFFALSLWGAVFFHIFFVFTFFLLLPLLVELLSKTKDWSTIEKRLLAISTCLAVAVIVLSIAQLHMTIGQYVALQDFHFVLNPLSINVAGGTGLNTAPTLLKFYLHHIVYLAFAAVIIIYPALTTGIKAKGLFWLLLPFLVFVEVLPRLGLKYDQERIWVFINIMVVSTVLINIDKLPSTYSSRLPKLLIVMAAISVIVTGYFIRTRAKPFGANDYEAVQYINRYYPDAVIVGPEVKAPGVNITKDDKIFYYIAFNNLLNFSPLALQAELTQISRLDGTAIRQKWDQKKTNIATIKQLLSVGGTIPGSLTTPLPDPVGPNNKLLLYSCSNINSCSSMGVTPTQLPLDYPFLSKIYNNSSVTLYLFSGPLVSTNLSPETETALENSYVSSYIKSGLPY